MAVLAGEAAAADCGCDTFSTPVDITSTSTTDIALEVSSSGGTSAISGINNGTSTYQHGVFGRAYGSNGIGVYGIGSGTSGYGGYAVATGTSGTGVYASSTATSGTNYGVYALNASTSGRALYARSTASTGSTYGVYGLVASTAGTGVYGASTASSGSPIGVLGSASATTGTGVYGYATASTGATAGVQGTASSTGGAGVYGWASATTGSANGLYGIADSTSGAGVRGLASSATGTTYGVVGQVISSSGYGLYSIGNFAATGTKSAIVPTSQGPTELYAEESTEVWFTDHGEGRLEGGLAHVDLDPDFLETVTVDERHPLMVFVQLEGEANGVYVEKYEDGFDVVELMNGESDAPFSYRVVAHRAGYEDRRLRRVDVDLEPHRPEGRGERPVKLPSEPAPPAAVPAPKGASRL